MKSFQGDRVIWVVVFMLSIISIVAVYSTTGTLAYKYQGGNTEYYLFKHVIILLLALGLMYVAHRIRYSYYSRIAQIALYVAVPLLVLTLFFGTTIHDASRWYKVLNFSFQPSDFAKLALIMFLARLLTKKQDAIKDFRSAFVPIIVPVIVTCGLILPSNFSTAALLFITCVILMFLGRVNIRYILSLIGIGSVVLVIFFVIVYRNPEVGRFGTWKQRIESYINPQSEDHYQIDQAKIAIANGGILGKLPGNSSQKNFLPHPYSDFIFAIIIESFGLVGGTVVVLLYMILFYRTIRIALRCQRSFGSFLALGLGFSIVFQAMVNMAVAVNLVPVTGQTLPLISMGGTSMWFTFIALGVIVSVSRDLEIQDDDINEEISKEYVAG
ncbi:MAG TPA: putative peptidoglycan glycosyltransferase FtsW [Bacteroidales bacterium]|nr:putative peptidoglycan glycosyltransferase FtsW [Bacteroidales bacterium]HNS46266.1 putative peptidoglycan glycosyltransferase FtsW [Bacteroidales bacterium]